MYSRKQRAQGELDVRVVLLEPLELLRLARDEAVLGVALHEVELRAPRPARKWFESVTLSKGEQGRQDEGARVRAYRAVF